MYRYEAAANKLESLKEAIALAERTFHWRVAALERALLCGWLSSARA